MQIVAGKENVTFSVRFLRSSFTSGPAAGGQGWTTWINHNPR